MDNFNQFNVYDKFSQLKILEDGIEALKLEYKYYININGNMLARRDGIYKSFEVLANKISDSNKAIVVFVDIDRLVVVYNDFWDIHHQSVLLDFNESFVEEAFSKKLNKIAEIVKIFCMGFDTDFYFIHTEGRLADIASNIFKKKLPKIKIFSINDVKDKAKECYFIENNKQKSKTLGLTLIASVVVLVVLNSFGAYIDSLLKTQRSKELVLLQNKTNGIEADIVKTMQEIDELEKRIKDGKIWCN